MQQGLRRGLRDGRAAAVLAEGPPGRHRDESLLRLHSLEKPSAGRHQLLWATRLLPGKGTSTSPALSPALLGHPGWGRQGSEGRTQTQALAQCSACSPNCTSSQSRGGKCHVELCQQTLPLWRLPPPYNADEASTYCVSTTRPGSRRQRVNRTDEAVPCGAQSPPAPCSPGPRQIGRAHV